MAIVIKSKKVTLPIENEQGEKLGEVVFNPDSAETYKALTEIAELVYKISDKRDSMGELKTIPTGEVESVEKEKAYRDEFMKINEFTTYMTETIDKIAEAIDSAFGKGTSELILQGGYDIEGLIAFVEGISPYFEGARAKRIDKYVNDDDGVM